MRRLSVIIPCRNKEAVIRRTYTRLSAVFRRAGVDAEIIFVDDGSGDGTVARLREISGTDRSVCLVRLSRSFGPAAAVSAGLRYCTGDAAVILDADLQDPPEEVPRMLEVMDRERCSVVYGRRVNPDGERGSGPLARARRRFRDFLSGVKLPAGAEDFRVIDRRVIEPDVIAVRGDCHVRVLQRGIAAPFDGDDVPDRVRHRIHAQPKIAAHGPADRARRGGRERTA